MRGPAEVEQGAQDHGPAVALAHPQDIVAHGFRGRRVGQDLDQGVGERLRILGGDRAAQSLVLDEAGEGVAAGAHDGQARPEVVEDAGAEGEGGLDVVEVAGDADVGLQEEIDPLGVGHPLLVEDDVGADQVELLRQRAGLDRHLHLGHRRVGVLDAHEEQLDLGDPVTRDVDGADEGERVEPVIDA